jgi:hypothetical protein
MSEGLESLQGVPGCNRVVVGGRACNLKGEDRRGWYRNEGLGWLSCVVFVFVVVVVVVVVFISVIIFCCCRRCCCCRRRRRRRCWGLMMKKEMECSKTRFRWRDKCVYRAIRKRVRREARCRNIFGLAFFSRGESGQAGESHAARCPSSWPRVSSRAGGCP